jgi:hypothetical protein
MALAWAYRLANYKSGEAMMTAMGTFNDQHGVNFKGVSGQISFSAKNGDMMEPPTQYTVFHVKGGKFVSKTVKADPDV